MGLVVKRKFIGFFKGKSGDIKLEKVFTSSQILEKGSRHLFCDEQARQGMEVSLAAERNQPVSLPLEN